jgi:hypothetical protein
MDELTVMTLNEQKWVNYEAYARLEEELHQQRFNNKHNLSIDQKVSDKIAELEQELATTKEALNIAVTSLTEIEDLPPLNEYARKRISRDALAKIKKRLFGKRE